MRRRGAFGSARDRRQLQDDPVLDPQVWTADREAIEETAQSADGALASGRNGLLDRRSTDVSVARRRRRGRGARPGRAAQAGQRDGAEVARSSHTKSAG